MPTGEETIKNLENHYGKLLAIVMNKYKLRHVVVTTEDIIQAQPDTGLNLVVQELEDGMHLRLVSDKEARKLQSLENKLNPPR